MPPTRPPARPPAQAWEGNGPEGRVGRWIHMRRKVNSGSKSKDFSVVPLRLPPRLSRASPARWPPSPTCRTHALRGAASCHAHALQFCPFVPPHLSTQPTPRSHIGPRPSSLNLPSVIRRTIAIQTHHHAVPPMAPRCPCRLPVRDDRCRPAHDATRSGWPSLALSSLYTLYPLPFVRSPSHCSTVLYPCAALSFIHPAPNHHGFHSAPSTRSCHVTCCSTDVITSPRRRVPASGLAQVTIACHSNFPVSLQTWVAPGNGTGAVTEFPCNSSDTFLINVAGATEFQLVYHKAVEQKKRKKSCTPRLSGTGDRTPPGASSFTGGVQRAQAAQRLSSSCTPRMSGTGDRTPPGASSFTGGVQRVQAAQRLCTRGSWRQPTTPRAAAGPICFASIQVRNILQGTRTAITTEPCCVSVHPCDPFFPLSLRSRYAASTLKGTWDGRACVLRSLIRATCCYCLRSQMVSNMRTTVLTTPRPLSSQTEMAMRHARCANDLHTSRRTSNGAAAAAAQRPQDRVCGPDHGQPLHTKEVGVCVRGPRARSSQSKLADERERRAALLHRDEGWRCGRGLPSVPRGWLLSLLCPCV